LQQTLISECVIYFISDNSPYEGEMFDFFHHIEELNCVFLKNKQRMGPGAARNVGINHAHGEFLFFLDVDDGFFENNALEKLYDAVTKNNYDIAIIPVLDHD
jgi:glycosyltransferase involved in cell wall biosynthesis